MPRDINGVYTLPAGNPVVPGTVISTNWANNTLTDIAAALTASITQTAADARYLKLTGGTLTGGLTVPSLNGGQLAGMRNKLINANFQANQRAYVSGTATTGANQYTLDRWRVVTSGQNLTFATSGNGNQITAPAGGVEQVIEGINIEGGTYVLSWTGTATATVNGTARAKGEAFTLTANTNATVRFTGGTVSLAQLEVGAVATPFEHRPYGAELALCQRYTCLVENGGGGQPVCNVGFTSSTTIAHGAFRYPVRMRAAPTFAILSGNATSFSVLGAGGGDISLTALTVDQVGVDGCRMVATSGTALPQGYASVLRATTSPIAVFSAEL